MPTADPHTNVVVAALSIARRGRPRLPRCGRSAAVASSRRACTCCPACTRRFPVRSCGIVIVTLLALVLPIPLAVIGALPAQPARAGPAEPRSRRRSRACCCPRSTVAALAAIESLLSARVAASLADTGPYDPDRELVGQGLASIGAGLFGGMPATGAIARTAVNVRAGAQTQRRRDRPRARAAARRLAAAGPVGAIPLAALSGVLMVTADADGPPARPRGRSCARPAPTRSPSW